jgi:uncharacterized protein
MDSIVPTPANPRDESFGYICRRCLKCCRHKRIPLDPYEIARLARNRGVTTSEFRDAWTEQGAGLYLSQTEDGACVFLGSEGCTVHPDRPLACRLYPLGRHVFGDGTESFFPVEPHPQSLGELTRSGTVADFLTAQGAQPFMQATDDYFAWLMAVHESMDGMIEKQSADLPADAKGGGRDLLDMDGAIAKYCAAAAVAEPTDIEVRRKLHLEILYRELELAKGVRHEQVGQDG